VSKKVLSLVLCLAVVVFSVALGVSLGLTGAQASPGKSLYLVANHHTAQFDAYGINADGTVTYQATYNLAHASDPAGVAIDESSTTLMVTSEFSGGVEFVDATLMTSLGVSAGPTNLAGIDTDDENDVVFTVGRNTANIYVYDWNPATTSLTLKAGYPMTLPNCQNAFGIAYDSIADTLWVADAGAGLARSYTVSADFSTWTGTGNFMPVHKPVDIAVDRVNGFVYTVSMTSYASTPAGTGSNSLSKYDLGTATETTVDMGREGVGVAVDEDTGYVYVTGGYWDFTAGSPATNPQTLQVWDPSTTPFTMVQETGDLGSPAGICVPREEVGYGIPVPVDIKPTSCPNPLNTKGKGVLPVAILGTEDLDVTQIDPASVRLAEEVAPLRWAWEDVATPYEPFLGKEDCYNNCTTEGPDGYMDLTFKFDSQEVVAALGDVSDGECLVVELTGNLMEEYDGDPIVGEDVVLILKKE
jgi:hypothetical protein